MAQQGSRVFHRLKALELTGVTLSLTGHQSRTILVGSHREVISNFASNGIVAAKRSPSKGFFLFITNLVDLDMEKYFDSLDFYSFLEFHPTSVWQKQGFELEESLARLKGPMIEIAGPTIQGYQLIPEKFLGQMLVSNAIEKPFRDPNIGPSRYGIVNALRPKARLDFVANGLSLPFRKTSVGAVFVSAFPDSPMINEGKSTKARSVLLKQIAPVVEKSGLLVWQNGHAEDARNAEDLGLVPVMAQVNIQPEKRIPLDQTVLWSHTRALFVFQKF